MSLESIYQDLLFVGVQTVTAVPDSLLAPLCNRLRRDGEIEYIQATHEATAVAIAAGLTLTGVRTLVVMENSGLRTACETLARFNLSHHLFICCLLSHRGAFGERNWWGVNHHETMKPLLDVLRMRYQHVTSEGEFRTSLLRAYDMLAAGQGSIALIADPGLTRSLVS